MGRRVRVARIGRNGVLRGYWGYVVWGKLWLKNLLGWVGGFHLHFRGDDFGEGGMVGGVVAIALVDRRPI